MSRATPQKQKSQQPWLVEAGVMEEIEPLQKPAYSRGCMEGALASPNLTFSRLLQRPPTSWVQKPPDVGA